jgi:glutathione S-transferase
MPVLREGSRLVPDSSAIIDYLERTRGKPLDAALTPKQRAIATAIKAMLEEQLYFVVLHQRWKQDHNWALYKPVFVELAGKLGVPSFLRNLVVGQIRKQMVASLHGQGIGRHTPDEAIALGIAILDSVSELCEGPFFFGDQPSTIDATVYAFVASIAQAPFEGPLKERALRDAKLSRYCAHVKAACGF